MEKQQSFRGVMEKQKSFRGFIEKQKSFRIVMEKQLSFMGSERKKSKESPGKRGDSPLHLAARAGNFNRVKEIIQNCPGNESKALLSKQNLEGETPLYVASENGHALVVSEMLKHLDLQTASIAARNGYDPFHVAAKQGHLEVLRELLHSFPNLAMTTDLSNSTALHTAAIQGHIDVVNLLLESDSNLAKIARNNGKTVLHSAARMGHLEVVKALLNKDPSTGFRTDKKGQTALHMAVKGQNEEILLELVKPDPAVLCLEDNKGNTALHIATKKGRTQNVRRLLSIEGIDINATNKATTLKKISLYSSALFLAVSLMSSCSGSHDDAKETAQDANEEKFDGKEEKAADHLVDAYSGNMYEVKVSENASLNASDPEVKRIAAMMVEAHSKMNSDVANLAGQKNVTLPTDLSDEQRKCIEKLTEKTGLDYDKEYISDLKDKHEKTLKKLEKLSEKCDDPEIKNWATGSIPEVRHHLDMVNAAHESLKARKS